jgi:hypothetical protein
VLFFLSLSLSLSLARALSNPANPSSGGGSGGDSGRRNWRWCGDSSGCGTGLGGARTWAEAHEVDQPLHRGSCTGAASDRPGSIDNAAVLADLASNVGEEDIAHLDHRSAKVAEEETPVVGTIELHERLGGVGVGAREDVLVRGQEVVLAEKVLEVVVVERVYGARVQRRRLVAVAAMAERLQAQR